jgi:DNA-binding MarR family transcriptional regulator
MEQLEAQRDRHDNRLGSSLFSFHTRGNTLPDFVQTAVKGIDDQLRVLREEASRLEAARAALTGGRRRAGRPARNGAVHAPARPARRRNGHAAAPRGRRTGSTRANQALELVRQKPGITIPEIATAMKIQPNYLYRVLPRLASNGEIKRDGQGWHPASSSSSSAPAGTARKVSARKVSARKRTRGTKSTSATPARRTGTARTRRSTAASSTTNGRTAPGATKASVLAALSRGEAMTAGQVATKAGLARPTVSTTLSKLAKTGEVQKAARGYLLAPAS